MHHEKLIERLVAVDTWMSQDPVRRRVEIVANPHLIEGSLPGVTGPCRWQDAVLSKGVLKFDHERMNSVQVEEDVSVWADREVYLKWKMESYAFRLPVHAVMGIRAFIPEETVMVFE